MGYFKITPGIVNLQSSDSRKKKRHQNEGDFNSKQSRARTQQEPTQLVLAWSDYAEFSEQCSSVPWGGDRRSAGCRSTETCWDIFTMTLTAQGDLQIPSSVEEAAVCMQECSLHARTKNKQLNNIKQLNVICSTTAAVENMSFYISAESE